MSAVLATKLNLTARDASGQRKFVVRDVRADATVQELIRGLVPKMGLPAEDSTGMAQSFHVFHESSGRHLRASETVGEVLRNEDEITLHPDVQAGSRAAKRG